MLQLGETTDYRAEDEICKRQCLRGHVFWADSRTPVKCPICENIQQEAVLPHERPALSPVRRAMAGLAVVLFLAAVMWAVGSGAEQDAKNTEDALYTHSRVVREGGNYGQ